MRLFLINPLIVALATGIGLFACKALGVNAHVREMLMAAIICLVAAELAAIPAMVAQKQNLKGVARFQAAFIGTVLHLGIVLIVGIFVIAEMRSPKPFVYWLLPLYWLTLIGLCTAFVFLLRTSVTPGDSGSLSV